MKHTHVMVLISNTTTRCCELRGCVCTYIHIRPCFVKCCGGHTAAYIRRPPPLHTHTHTHPHTHVGNNLHTLNTIRKVCELDFNQGHMPSTQHKDGDLNGWRRCLPNTAIYRGRGRAPRRLWLRLLSEHAIHQLYVIRSCPYTRITYQSTTHKRLYLRLKSFSRHSLATPYTHTQLTRTPSTRDRHR